MFNQSFLHDFCHFMFSQEEITRAKKLFLKIHSHRYDFIFKVSPNSRNWRSSNWITVEPCFSKKTQKMFNPTLSDQDILNVLCGQKVSIFSASKKIDDVYLLGVRFNKFTRYFVIDIDVRSEYHNIDSIQKIVEILNDFGKPIFLQSSNTGGWHLRWYFSEPIKTWLVASHLKVLLEDSDFILKPGKLEIFPNRKANRETFYNGIRLPCQQGSALLSLEDGRMLAKWADDPETFVCFWAEEVYRNLIDVTQLKIFQSTLFPNPKTQAWYERCLSIKDRGFTSLSQTNKLIGTVAEYYRVFEGISDVGELTKQLCSWIDEKHNGLSEEYNQSPQLAYYHCERWAKCAISKRTPINKNVKYFKSNNYKIAKAAKYDHIFKTALSSGKINLQMSQREIAHILGISRKAVQNRLKKSGSFCWLLLLLWSHLYPFYKLGLSAVLC